MQDNSEAEFLKANEKVKQQQAENRRKAESLADVAPTKPAIVSKPKNSFVPPPPEPKPPTPPPPTERPCSDCGVMTPRAWRCEKCEAYAIRKSRFDRLRESRQKKAEKWNAEIEKHIPLKFQQERAHINKLSKALQTIIAELPRDHGLYLHGLPGVGKSFTMAAIARQRICQNFTIRRIRFDDLLTEIRQTYKPDSTESEAGIIDRMAKAGCLFIEDLGATTTAGQETDFTQRTLLSILDRRIEACRATFITSNLSPDQLEKKFDARIGSRLAGMCEAIKLAGRDKRRGQVGGKLGASQGIS